MTTRKSKALKVMLMLAAILVLCLVVAVSSFAQGGKARGVTDTTVKIGAMVDLTGPYKGAGIMFKQAMEAVVKKVNAEGGIHGRKLLLVVEDNQASPAVTTTVANKLIYMDNVLCFAHVMGTAAAEAIYDLIDKEKVPTTLGTQASIYKPFKKYLFMPWASYANETARAIDYIIEDLKIKNPKIGALIQDDAYGTDAADGLKAQEKFRGLKYVAWETYPRGNTDFSTQALKFKQTGAEQVIMTGSYVAASQLIKELTKINHKPLIIGASPTTDKMLMELVGPLSDGYMATCSFPQQLGDPGFKEADEIVVKYGGAKGLSNYHLFGLVLIETMIEGIKAAGKDLNTETLVKGLESLKDVTVPGLLTKITFGPNKHVSSDMSAILKVDYAQKKWIIVSQPKAPKVKGL